MRILVLSPHPDDESLGPGGTIVGHVAAGDSVHVVFLTSGEMGGHGSPPEETSRRREQEAAAAARILGISGFEFWNEPDGQLERSAAVIDRLSQRIAALEPGVVYAPHPAEQHRDHATAALIARDACDGRSLRLLGYEVWTPLARIDAIVDVTESMPVKLAAIRAHASQCAVLRFDAAFEGLARYRGEMHSWPGGPYAEAFVDLRATAWTGR